MKCIPPINPKTAVHTKQYNSDKRRREFSKGLFLGLILLATWIVSTSGFLYGQESDDALFIDQDGNVMVGKKLRAEKFEGDGSSITVRVGEGDNSLRIPEALAMLVPIGTIMAYVGDVTNQEIKNNLEAQGWLVCDGSKKETSAEYKDLYAVISGAFGGDAKYFYLPDMRGRFLRGVDQGTGRDPDAKNRMHPVSGKKVGGKVGSVQEDQIKSHSHTVDDHGHGHNISIGKLHHRAYEEYQGSFAIPAGINKQWGVQKNLIKDEKTGITLQNTGGSETRPQNIYVNWIIKAKHIIRTRQ